MKSKKYITFFISFLLIVTSAQAKVDDAFKGIYSKVPQTITHSLNGMWKLKVVKGISDNDDRCFAKSNFDDSSWKSIPVPGNWEIYGFSEARYTSPDSLTGYYRKTFTLPWTLDNERTILRLDGVLRDYILYINGHEAGSWESSYNTCLFDITPYLNRHGSQTIALRVVSRFKGWEFDTYDDWGLMGIFRDVTLFKIPQKHLSDFTITTEKITENAAEIKLRFAVTDSKNKKNSNCRINAHIKDNHGKIVENFVFPLNNQGKGDTTIIIKNPKLWTSETPNLYSIDFSLWEKTNEKQHFTEKFGIRKLTIDGKMIKLNGQQIKLRGVTLHATDPSTGKVITDQLTLKDMRLMKEASVNLIRCSHYTREPRFFELCDSLGFYTIDEVSFGFGDKHLTDSTYRDILLTHADATVKRDKNHPCVILWSIGNENPFTPMTGEVGQRVLRLDLSREICYPQIGSYFQSLNYNLPDYVRIFAPHYPNISRLKTWAEESSRPIILTEYCHSLGQSFEDHDQLWNVIEQNNVLAGGCVWEWVDQGVPFKRPFKSQFGYIGDVYTSQEGGFTMNGNKGTDGLLYADRTPLSNYFELQHNYAQAFITDSIYKLPISGGPLNIHLSNRYDFLDLKDNVNFQWTLTADFDTIQCGCFSPQCAPHCQSTYALNINSLPKSNDKNAIYLLNFTISDRNGIIFNHQTIKINPTDIKQRLLDARLGKGSPMDYIQGKMMMRTGRKLSMSEGLKVKDEVSNRYLKPIKEGLIIDTIPGGWHVKFHFDKKNMPPIILEGGVAMLLNPTINRMQWLGYGPFASYPGKKNANHYGLYTMTAGDLYFEGNRLSVDAALATNEQGEGLLVVCDSANAVNFEQTDQGVVLSINALVSGLGPKSSRTSHPVIQQDLVGSFYILKVNAKDGLLNIFKSPSLVKKAQNHFLTQYDTYQMRFRDIFDENSQEVNIK